MAPTANQGVPNEKLTACFNPSVLAGNGLKFNKVSPKIWWVIFCLLISPPSGNFQSSNAPQWFFICQDFPDLFHWHCRVQILIPNQPSEKVTQIIPFHQTASPPRTRTCPQEVPTHSFYSHQHSLAKRNDVCPLYYQGIKNFKSWSLPACKGKLFADSAGDILQKWIK